MHYLKKVNGKYFADGKEYSNFHDAISAIWKA